MTDTDNPYEAPSSRSLRVQRSRKTGSKPTARRRFFVRIMLTAVCAFVVWPGGVAIYRECGGRLFHAASIILLPIALVIAFVGFVYAVASAKR